MKISRWGTGRADAVFLISPLDCAALISRMCPPMHDAVLLTGSNGFLGSLLLKQLAAAGYPVVAMKRSTSDLTRISPLPPGVRLYNIDQDPLEKIFGENRVGLIVHCATNYGRRPVPPSEIVESNLILPLKLLQSAAAHGVHGFINTDTILDKRVNHYSLSKRQFVDWLELFSEKLVCINAALEHFYGPFDDRSKFVTDVLLGLMHGAPRIDLTAGEQRRDFIYIDDVVAAFMAIVAFARGAEEGFHRFEVGSGRLISIRDFVLLAREVTQGDQTHLNFGALPYRRHEVMESRCDISALQQLGWNPQVSLRQGLARTVELERRRLSECDS